MNLRREFFHLNKRLMKSYKIIFVAIFALFSFACFWSEESPNTNINGAEKMPANQNAELPANMETNAVQPNNDVVTQPQTDVIPKTEEIKSFKTPTEAYKTFIVATFNKDIDTIKQTVSSGSMKYLEEAAKQQNTTFAELLIGGKVEEIDREIPEIKNEKISGNKATIEVKNEAGLYDTIPMIKENGEWKFALDELGRQAQKNFDEMKKRLAEEK